MKLPNCECERCQSNLQLLQELYGDTRPSRGTAADLSESFAVYRRRVVPAGVEAVLLLVGPPLPWYGRLCLWILQRIRGVEVIR